jgi:hypothetical protein
MLRLAAMHGNQLESSSFHPAGRRMAIYRYEVTLKEYQVGVVGRIASQEDAAQELPPEVLKRMRREDPTASAAANTSQGSCTVPAVKVDAALLPGTKRATTMMAAPCRASASPAQVSRRLASAPRNSRPAAEAPAVRQARRSPPRRGSLHPRRPRQRPRSTTYPGRRGSTRRSPPSRWARSAARHRATGGKNTQRVGGER